MLTEWLAQQKNLTPAEIAQADTEFRSLGIAEKEDVWQALHAYFLKAPISADRRFWFSYFRWYTDLTWRLFPEMTEEIVVSIAFPRQLIMAILLGYDPVISLITFLNARPYEDIDIERVYTTIRDGVTRSGALVGVAKGREVSYAELVKELTAINKANDTLRLAEFASRLKEVLYPKFEDALQQRYFEENQDDIIRTCMSSLSFFIGVEPSAIVALVKTAFHPEYFDTPPAPVSEKKQVIARPAAPVDNDGVVTDSGGDQPVATASPSSVGVTAKTLPITRVITSAAEPDIHPTDKTVPPSTTRRPSNGEIKKMVEALFPMGSGSEEERLPKILSLLETLALRYGDETIRDLYFFNPDHNSFEWLE